MILQKRQSSIGQNRSRNRGCRVFTPALALRWNSLKLHELMPAYDMKAAYSMRVNATPRRVWQECMDADFSQMPLTRRLMALRTLGRKKTAPGEPRTLATMGERGAGGF